MTKLLKLHRSKQNCMIAGVCGGIAEYIGWTPTAVRLAFLLIIALTTPVTLGSGALIYFIMWVLMPEATPSSYAPSTSQEHSGRVYDAR